MPVEPFPLPTRLAVEPRKAMKVPQDVIELVEEYSEWLPFFPVHGWKSSPDEGGHTHCRSCRRRIHRGDPVVGTYLRYVSVVFCPKCVSDNPTLFRRWAAAGFG